ncbi:MAG: glutamine--tRNA ligase, partial [Clostridia bacterium]
KIICTADIESGNGNAVDGRKIKGTIHWVSATESDDISVRVYEKLFTIENTADIPEDETLNDYLNTNSVKIYAGCKAEKSLSEAKDGDKFQFVRTGYFCKDAKYVNTYNQITELKDSKPIQI